MKKDIKVDDIIELNGSIYVVREIDTEYYFLQRRSTSFVLSNDLIFKELEIIDIEEFYIKYGLKAGIKQVIKLNGIFPPISSLEDLQKLIKILEEIIPYGTYNGYLRSEKLKLI